MRTAISYAFGGLTVLLSGCALLDGKTKPNKAVDPPPPVSLRFHLAAAEARPGYFITTGEDGRPLHVASAPIVTDAEVWRASVLTSKEKSLILVEFTPRGAQALQAATRDAAGQHLAVYLNDRLIMSPALPGPIYSGQLYLGGAFESARAAEIARALNWQREQRAPVLMRPERPMISDETRGDTP